MQKLHKAQHTGKTFPRIREINGGALKTESAQYHEKSQMTRPINAPNAVASKIDTIAWVEKDKSINNIKIISCNINSENIYK